MTNDIPSQLLKQASLASLEVTQRQCTLGNRKMSNQPLSSTRKASAIKAAQDANPASSRAPGLEKELSSAPLRLK